MELKKREVDSSGKRDGAGESDNPKIEIQESHSFRRSG